MQLSHRLAPTLAAVLLAGATWLAGHPIAAELSREQAPAPADDSSVDAASETPAEAADPQELIYDRVMVLGDPEHIEGIPGSAHLIDLEQLERQEHSDIHRILWQVPGVNIQEEEGYGLRPNIGLRGTGVERSQKITLMEDGVLIAPAPYSAPSAYYFPTAGRMEAVEVRKGSSAIKQGPYTNGGAINLVSRSIPDSFAARLGLTADEYDSLRGHAFIGDSRDRFGWLAESYQLQGESFKQLDGGQPAELELQDYVGKLRVNSSAEARIYQALELKLGRTDHYGEETYLGLAEDDFRRTPLRRYAGSQADFLDSEHEQLQLRYFAMPHARVDITSTIYRNEFARNWHKLERVLGTSISSVLDDPHLYPLELAILRGQVDSGPEDLAVRNNRRQYDSEGWQTVVAVDLGQDRARQVELGVRWHRDSEDRFQEFDSYLMRDGRMSLTQLGSPGSDSNRISEADAVALFLAQELEIGRFKLSPGLRYESISYQRRDFGKSDPARTGADPTVRRNDVDEWIPGLGVTYGLNSTTSLFVGLHKGFSPPGPGSTEEVEAEESLNVELGLRRGGPRWRADLVAFFNDYDNLLGRDTVSSGGTGSGDQFNGGEVRIAGVEAMLSGDLAARLDSKRSIPVRLAYTYTESEFRSSFTTSFADWAPQVTAGDEIPYLPAHQLFAGLSWIGDRLALHLDGTYASAMRSQAGQGAIPDTERIDERLVFDLGAELRLSRRLELSARVRNLLDEIYIAARRPAGLRPGLPRAVEAGIRVDF